MVPTAAASAAVPKLKEIDTASELVRHAPKRADFLIKEATVSPAVKCKTLGSKTSTGSGGKKRRRKSNLSSARNKAANKSKGKSRAANADRGKPINYKEVVAIRKLAMDKLAETTTGSGRLTIVKGSHLRLQDLVQQTFKEDWLDDKTIVQSQRQTRLSEAEEDKLLQNELRRQIRYETFVKSTTEEWRYSQSFSPINTKRGDSWLVHPMVFHGVEDNMVVLDKFGRLTIYLRPCANRITGFDTHNFRMLHDAWAEMPRIRWLRRQQQQQFSTVSTEQRNRDLKEAASVIGFDADTFMEQGYCMLDSIFSEKDLTTIETAASQLPCVKNPKQQKTDKTKMYNVHNNQGKLSTDGLPNTIMQTALMKSALFPFLNNLLESGVNTKFRARKQDGSVQIAYRPPGWSNCTTEGGWKGHFDGTGSKLSVLIGICLRAPC
jgi:hypothetical protein